jgi:hypothetical protein
MKVAAPWPKDGNPMADDHSVVIEALVAGTRQR